ncbi:unnamed protein product [Closterium sp. NIES-53]
MRSVTSNFDLDSYKIHAGNALAAGTGAAAAALALAAAGAAAATGSSGLASARRVLSSARAAYSAAAGSAGGGSSGLASASGVLRSARATLPAAAGSASGGSSSGLASARRVLRSARAAFAAAASGGGSGLAAARGVLSGAGASLAAGAGGGSHCPLRYRRDVEVFVFCGALALRRAGLQCSKSADIDMETVASADAGGLEVPAVEVTSMQFAYPGEPPLISKFNLTLPRGSRCLLIGANGAGKTTLLRVLAGKHMVGGKDVVKVLGRSAFHDTALSCDGSLAYLGGSWSKSVGCATSQNLISVGIILPVPLMLSPTAFPVSLSPPCTPLAQCPSYSLPIADSLPPSLQGEVSPQGDFNVELTTDTVPAWCGRNLQGPSCRGAGVSPLFLFYSIRAVPAMSPLLQGEVPLQGDFSAEHMIYGVADVDAARRDHLVELLDIDLTWRMHRVSDGQRRRVQICMGLLRPFQVLLLDEVTVDLDVVARMDLLSFFQQECEERGATVVYATHIFDGLESWASHLAFVSSGKLQRLESVDASTQQSADSHKPPALQLPSLLEMVEPWLREDKAKREQEVEEAKKRGDVPKRVDPFAGAGRHMAYYR